MGKYKSDDMLQFVAFKLKSQGQVTIYAPEEVPIAHTKQLLMIEGSHHCNYYSSFATKTFLVVSVLHRQHELWSL